MKVDWDKLRRLHEAAVSVETYTHFENVLVRHFPAILAERSAAQRLRDAVLHHFGTEGVKQWKNIADAIAAFDKDTQND